MSENVYQAMISRGYTGKPRVMADLRSNRIDVVFTIAVICFAALVLGLILTDLRPHCTICSCILEFGYDDIANYLTDRRLLQISGWQHRDRRAEPGH